MLPDIGAAKDQSYQHRAGTFYLQFNGSERYAVAVWEP